MGRCVKLMLEAEQTAPGIVKVEDKITDVLGYRDLQEKQHGGGILATGRSVSWVVCTRNVSCEDPMGRGCQDGVDSPEHGVGGHIMAPVLFPAINNSLVVAINHEWCTRLIYYE